ncbi:MAG TPA: oxidoreductase [Flavobacteriaceae bacterium]|nr:oxidoreductase [Flavobacteriaceae bacterium]MAY52418.1 oxidoreductase [Flavobacteriaceae bacterium]HBR54588.1 oxidoreductase [Flavobacteriaceae bacterium]|tara:strand:- start:12338 stop:13378 length:1041 start_codon:yes stop_codon:yes gene_type:complete
MRILIICIATVLLFSCSSETDNTFTEVAISRVFTDSLSIRAIAPLDENGVWFAANNGRVGLIDGDTPKLATIHYEDSILAFRAIAKTKKAVFVLSIASPAVLYKIGVEDRVATKIEEVYVENGDKVFYDAMAFWNDQEGIAMGDPTNGCLSIIVTRDGGDTWSKINCDNLPNTDTGEAAFAASNSNIAVYKDHVWIVSGGKRSRVFHSADKGETWEVFETPIIQGKAMTGIYTVDFYDENTGVVFGGNWEDQDFNEGNKAITHDGGKTWKLLSNGSGPGYRSSVSFVPGTKGNGLVAVGSLGISYSPDQGASWSELSSEGFYAIEFVNDTLAFASGRNKISKLIFR